MTIEPADCSLSFICTIGLRATGSALTRAASEIDILFIDRSVNELQSISDRASIRGGQLSEWPLSAARECATKAGADIVDAGLAAHPIKFLGR